HPVHQRVPLVERRVTLAVQRGRALGAAQMCAHVRTGEPAGSELQRIDDLGLDAARFCGLRHGPRRRLVTTTCRNEQNRELRTPCHASLSSTRRASSASPMIPYTCERPSNPRRRARFARQETATRTHGGWGGTTLVVTLAAIRSARRKASPASGKREAS